MHLKKLPEFVEAQEFANRVGPAINIWEAESFGDFTVDPDGLLFTRETPSFSYTDNKGKKVIIQIDDTSARVQVSGIFTELNGAWWGADSYEIHCSSHSPVENRLPGEEKDYPIFNMRWCACPSEENFGKLFYLGYELQPGQYFHFYYGKDGKEHRHSMGEDPNQPFAPSTLHGQRALLGREIPWEIDVTSKVVEILQDSRFKEFCVMSPVGPE